ncbi:hypothetical protein FB451DRAFT_1373962 [Mycena latifolia]|nr:hypothetical protein FB451DRAFT_1373962 [Mycena latifolia]
MATNSSNAAPTSSFTGKAAIFRPSKPSSQSTSDWLSTSLTTAKGIAAGAECIPFPGVKSVFGTAVVILETVEKVKRNRDDLKELCGNIMEIVGIVQDQLSSHGDTAAVKFKGPCEDLEGALQGILKAVKQLQSEPRSLSGRFNEVMKLGSTTDELNKHRMKMQELRSNFLLLAAIDTNLQVHKVHEALVTATLPANLSGISGAPNTNNCPPPSRIFHGRKIILEEMHAFFLKDLGDQHIFLLHGLGGVGKTQIALKFIEESLSHFTEIFLIDTSSVETIESGLKNIAATKGVGATAQDALQSLCKKADEWLLLFDNADDPKINLNNWIPRSKHGNILITSRNPELRVYAGSHCLVSGMEEKDAVELLLKSAAEDNTPHAQKIAADIVKALWYLPLAIIQAGAFIAKSGDIESYLDLYTKNRAQLLSEKPAQSHDNYAWTVYTTWQISFDRLSKPAAAFLQLCSFLHHEGISEQTFRIASMYEVGSYGPSKEDLHKPLEFLAQFSGPDGWNSLSFLKLINEIRAYSLINFDMRWKLYSIHPLVHAWSHGTIPQGELESHHQCMTSIVGMASAGIRWEDKQLASLRLLPHINSLLQGGIYTTTYFTAEYGSIYYYAGKPREAIKFQLAVLENERSLRGEDHPETLIAMGNLASTYCSLNQFQKAKDLEVVVLEKRRKSLGEQHLRTLHTMANLAATHFGLGEVLEAEELELMVLEKRRELQGDNHPETLRAMGNLASTHQYLGHLNKAKELILVVLERQRNLLGDAHPDTLVTMGNLALIYKNLGRLAEAADIYDIVLEKRRNLLGDHHPDTLEILRSLGSIFYDLGDLNQAEKLYISILKTQREVLGDSDLETLHTMDELAVIYQKLGHLNKAEEMQIVVLEKRKRLLGNNHPDTLLVMVNLALTYRNLRRFQEAKELEVGALEERRDLLGEDHPDTLEVMQNLSATHYHLGEFKETEQLCVNLLEKQKKLYGEDHQDTLHTISNLALAYQKLGQLKRTQELEVLLLEKRQKLLGEDHPQTLQAMQNLLITYCTLGKLNEAEELQVAMLKKKKRLLGENHPETLQVVDSLASIYDGLGKFPEAEQLYIELMDKQTTLLGADHPDTIQTGHNLATTRQALGNSKQAETETEKTQK